MIPETSGPWSLTCLKQQWRLALKLPPRAPISPSRGSSPMPNQGMNPTLLLEHSHLCNTLWLCHQVWTPCSTHDFVLEKDPFPPKFAIRVLSHFPLPNSKSIISASSHFYCKFHWFSKHQSWIHKNVSWMCYRMFTWCDTQFWGFPKMSLPSWHISLSDILLGQQTRCETLSDKEQNCSSFRVLKEQSKVSQHHNRHWSISAKRKGKLVVTEILVKVLAGKWSTGWGELWCLAGTQCTIH